MSPLPYCNNLQKGDPVEVAKTKRRGVVHSQPRETSVNVHVLLDGIDTARYFPVTELRLIVDGKAEDVPPIDGQPPTTDAQKLKDTDRPLHDLLNERTELSTRLLIVDTAIIRRLAAAASP